MLTETAVVKAALCLGGIGLGYMGLDCFCKNAGIQEPISAVARGAIAFTRNLHSEFSGVSAEQRALAEMAARRAYAQALADAAQQGTPTVSNSPVTQ